MLKKFLKKGGVLALMVLLLLTSCKAQEEGVQEVVVGTSGQTKPYNYFNEDNQLTGFEIEMLEEVDRRLEAYSFTYETTEFASLFAGLDAGKFDLIANNLGEKGQRRDLYLFSLYPYITTHNVLITRVEEGEDLTIEDMAGKSFGVAAGGPQAMFLEDYNAQNPDKAVVLEYVESDVSNIIRTVYTGGFDATIYATTYLQDVMETFGIDLRGHTIENEEAIRPPGSYLLFSKTQEGQALREATDQALATMAQDGTLAELSIKYFGEDLTGLSQELREKNDAIEEARLAEAEEGEASQGRLLALDMVPSMVATIIKRLPVTLLMTLVAALIGLVLGLAIAIIRLRRVPILSPLSRVFVSFMRGTPLLVQLFLAFYGLPLLVRWANLQLGTGLDVNAIPALAYVFIAFGLNESAYNSETFRAAILSVDPSEIEAGLSIGLTRPQVLRRIVLPSAMIVALPNLTNSLVSLLKATSLAFTVTVVDIMGQARIIAGANLRFFEAYIAVALIYWALSIVLEWVLGSLEARLNVDKAD